MMKKSILSLAVAGAFAAAGSASAALNLQNDGIGHILLVPYFTTQNGNSTLINLVNTDTVRGKAVKVRFRGGSDSDDIFDFQVFLSPGDVWTANISQNGSGLSTLTTSDSSCTLPAASVLNSTPFVTGRLSAAQAANGIGTREGYVEIFNMADLPSGTTTSSPVYATTKHTATGGAPTCDATILAGIESTYSNLTNAAGATQYAANGAATVTALQSPSTGLMANWTIINVPNTTVFSGPAVAIEATTATRIVYSQQTATAVAPVVASTAYPNIASTFDGVLLSTGFATAEYDFPDMSTPYEIATATAGNQAYDLSSSIAHTSIINEYLLETGISAKTDWLVSMPTRRYLVAGRGDATNGVTAGTGFYATTVPFVAAAANTTAATDLCSDETIAAYGSCTYGGNGTTAKSGAQAFFRNVTAYAADGRSSCVSIGNYSMTDRNEVSNVTTNVVVSPNVVTSVALCGEVNVLSLNNLTTNTGAVGANLVVAGLNVPYQSGWAAVNLKATAQTQNGGLPVIGYAFVKAVNPSVSAGISGNFGGTWAHRWNGKQ